MMTANAFGLINSSMIRLLVSLLISVIAEFSFLEDGNDDDGRVSCNLT